MALKLEGEHTFDAPRQRVWEALNDPDVLARTLPGAEKLEQVEENHFKGELAMRVGPVQGRFHGDVTLSNLQPPESYHLDLKGSGPAGFVNGAGDVRLEESGSGTVLHYDIEAQVGGRLAGVGQRLLESSARVITRQALEGLERQIDAPPEPVVAEHGAGVSAGVASGSTGGGAGTGASGAPGGSAAGGSSSSGSSSSGSPSAGGGKAGAAGRYGRPAAPSQAEFMVSFAKGLYEELVPEDKRGLTLWATLGAVLLGAFFLGRASKN